MYLFLKRKGGGRILTAYFNETRIFVYAAWINEIPMVNFVLSSTCRFQEIINNEKKKYGSDRIFGSELYDTEFSRVRFPPAPPESGNLKSEPLESVLKVCNRKLLITFSNYFKICFLICKFIYLFAFTEVNTNPIYSLIIPFRGFHVSKNQLKIANLLLYSNTDINLKKSKFSCMYISNVQLCHKGMNSVVQ